MPDIVNIDTKEASKKLQVIERNFMLVIVIVFGISIAYLYHQQQEMSGQLIQYLMNDGNQTQKIIQQNTDVLNRISTLIENNNKAIENIESIQKKNQ